MSKFRMAVAAVVLSSAAAAAATVILPALPFAQEPEKPTEHHKELLKGAGEWVGELSFQMPGMEPMAVPATDTVTAVGEFWTRSNFKCDFPGMGPYNGTGVIGYDAANKQYVGTWVDNTTSNLVVMKGERNADGALEMRWEAPVMGLEGMHPHRSVTVNTENTSEMKFYMGEGDAEVNQMTITMKRK